MRYDQPEVQHRLAAEYVLGTLRGAPRRRFERLLLERPALRETVHDWEQRLNGLVHELPERQPPRRVWRAIARRIAAERSPAKRWSRFGWPLAALAGVAAATVLAVRLVLFPVVEQPDYFAFVGVEEGQPIWSVAADTDDGELHVRALGAVPTESGTSLELWLLPPAAGETPQSLGLLPEDGDRRYALATQRLREAGQTVGLAVSREPTGGSPTGQPTGPIIFQAPMVRL